MWGMDPTCPPAPRVNTQEARGCPGCALSLTIIPEAHVLADQPLQEGFLQPRTLSPPSLSSDRTPSPGVQRAGSTGRDGGNSAGGVGTRARVAAVASGSFGAGWTGVGELQGLCREPWVGRTGGEWPQYKDRVFGGWVGTRAAQGSGSSAGQGGGFRDLHIQPPGAGTGPRPLGQQRVPLPGPCLCKMRPLL